MAKCMLCRVGLGLVAAAAIVAPQVGWSNEPPATEPAKPSEQAPTAPSETKPEITPATQPAPDAPKPEPANPYVLDFTMKDIDGNNVDLASFKGKVVLIVNVASKCGFTRQYKGLEELYQSKKEQGLVILGFPANNFGSQEPGTNAEIKAFCSSEYSVTFPMFAKVSVKGADQCDLYKRLASQPEPIGGDPGWNFTKFLVNREGNVVARYESRVRPNDTQMLTKIDELLGPGTAPAQEKPAVSTGAKSGS